MPPKSNPANYVALICPICGSQFLALRSVADRRVTCVRKDARASWLMKVRANQVGEASPAWKGGTNSHYYRKFLKESCEHCDSSGRLTIHHRDKDHSNNDLSNLATLCYSCHRR